MDRKKGLNIWWFGLLLLFKYRNESFCKLREKKKGSFWARAALSLAVALFCEELGCTLKKEGSLFPRMFQQCPVDHQCLPINITLSLRGLFSVPYLKLLHPGTLRFLFQTFSLISKHKWSFKVGGATCYNWWCSIPGYLPILSKETEFNFEEVLF